jgi:glycosyltransferase involved in cell wall biosynthesis
MRIALVLYGDLSAVSGGFLYDRMLVDALRRGGDTVDVIPFPRKAYAGCLLQNLDRGLRATLLGWNGDLMLQDELNHPSLFLLNRTLNRTRAFPVVAIVHHLKSSEQNPVPARGVYRRVERAYLRSVDGFVFNSIATRRSVAELMARPVGRLKGVVATPGGDRLGPLPTDQEVLSRCGTEGPLRLLFVGNIIPRKGLIDLIDALASIPSHLWRLTIAGSRGMDPGYAMEVDRAIAARGLAGNVSMAGPLDDIRLGEVYREHQVLVVPSRYEGFGIVYLEAMGFGVVPIGCRTGGAAEVIEHGKSGCLVPPGDSRALAEAIAGLAADRGLLRALAWEARRRFSVFPGWRSCMTSVREHLHEMSKGARHG